MTWTPTYRYVTEKPGMQARSGPPQCFVPASGSVDQVIAPPSPASDVASDISASVLSVAFTDDGGVESEVAATDVTCHDAMELAPWCHPRRPFTTKSRHSAFALWAERALLHAEQRD